MTEPVRFRKRVIDRLPATLAARLRQKLIPLNVRLSSKDLGRLALLYKTDKNGLHYYTQHYQRYFEGWRQRPLRILEIGVGGYADTQQGAWSLRMWESFFPQARIVGIDLYDKSHFSKGRVTVLQCDQIDAAKLHAILEQHGPFDIIIDDGSHLNEHVIASFKILFPLLKSPGFYAIEDLQTAYWPTWGGLSGQSSMDFLRSLLDGVNYVEHPFRTPGPYDQSLKEIAFFHNLCIIRKDANTEPSNAPDLIEEERKRAALSPQGR